jgi:hypothetical protein
MADIFISYARADQDKVRPLAKALEARTWSVWWDLQIRSGTPFDRVVEKALKEARSVIVVWSNKSIESDWVGAEAGNGLERGILISIAIEQDVRPPLRFHNIHTEPLIDWDGEKPSPAFDKIVADLEAILGRPEELEETSVEFEKKSKGEQHTFPELDAMVEVPAGEFIYQDGKEIIEKSYMIDVYPVNNEQFERFMKADGYHYEDYWSDEGWGWLAEGGTGWLKKEKNNRTKILA